jgi:HAD superfamily phosphoserine phosphatase-like hydrolase
MDEQASTSVIAFFDVDNTLIHGASAFHLVRGLRAAGLITVRDIVGAVWKQARFKVRGENDRHLASARLRGLEVLTGVWPEMARVARDHLQQGHQVWLVTASPAFLAEVIAERLGLTGAIASGLEVHDGIYTGRPDGEFLHGAHKAAAARRLLERTGADPAGCWAYSDSRHDIPLLSLVGHPVVVNPDRQLAHARASGWPVLDPRRSGRPA